MKPKEGNCIDCICGKVVPLIAKRCNYHYWKYRAKIKPIKPIKPIKKQSKTIAQVSNKRAKEQKIYSAKRIIFLVDNPYCEAKLVGCTKVSTDVHHTAGRIGKNYLDESTWKALCRECHKWVEENPKEAKDLGLSISRLNK